MTVTPLALVPLVGTAFYGWLFLVVRRGARGSLGAPEFGLHVGLLAAWSFTSLLWRLTPDATAQEYLLRILEVPLFSIPATFLYFLQAFYPTRRSRLARRAALLVMVNATVAALSGAINRLGVDPTPPETLWPHVLFYFTVAVAVATYAAAFAYVAYALRTHRDPFDQNRLRWVAVATAFTMLGSITNSIEALRVLPLDQAANGAAAALLAISIARFRLLDINVVLRRGAIHAVTAGMAATLYGLGTLAVIATTGIELLTMDGLLATLAVVGIVGLLSTWLQTAAAALVDRTFVGRWSRLDAPLAELARRSERLQSVESLAAGVVQVAQHAVEGTYVSLLLVDDATNRLRPAASAGPFPPPAVEIAISPQNEVLTIIEERNEPITPIQLDHILGSGAFRERTLTEFRPYLDTVLVPVRSHERLAGLIVAGPKIYDEPYDVSDLELLAATAGQAGLALENARIFDRLRAMGHTDYLTGLPNHRLLQEQLQEAIVRADTMSEPFAVAMIDIDNFKLLNDVHGHQAGDEALRRIAAAMRSSIREEDILGRYGGDEFLCILPGLDDVSAGELMARIARSVRKTPLVIGDSELAASSRLPARISWGVAAYPGDARTARNLTSIADSRLMQSRVERNRSGQVNAERPSIVGLLEQDPEKVRIASSLLDLINAKDPYTSEHSQQIASFALLVANDLGLPERERHALWLGSLLHDVGKLGTPADVLRKPGRLTPEEWTAMREHPLMGETIVRGLLDMPDVTSIVGGHHERWDGSGYPRGLAGEEIPPLVRLVSVADTFSAMVHDRPYRRGLAWPEAAEELRRSGGTQLDPRAVETFIRALGIDGSERSAA